MSRGYLQVEFQFPNAKNGSFYVYVAGGTFADYADVFDPISGAVLSQPLTIDSDGYAQAFHVDSSINYDILVKDFNGVTRFTRQNAAIIGGGSSTPGPQGPKGDKGDTGESIVGPAGADGTNGVDGQDGVDGVDGQDGDGLYSIYISNEETGEISYTKTSDPTAAYVAGNLFPGGVGQVKVTSLDSLGYLQDKFTAGDGISVSASNFDVTIENTLPETYKVRANAVGAEDYLGSVLQAGTGINLQLTPDLSKIQIIATGDATGGWVWQGIWSSATTYAANDAVNYYDASGIPVINRVYVATSATSANPYTDGTDWFLAFSIDSAGDQFVKLDEDDTLNSYLLDKIKPGDGISFARTDTSAGSYVTVNASISALNVSAAGINYNMNDLSNTIEFTSGTRITPAWDGTRLKFNHGSAGTSAVSAYKPTFDSLGHYTGDIGPLTIDEIVGLTSALSAAGDGKVAVDSSDTKGYLTDKLTASGAVELFNIGSPTDKDIQIVGTGKVATDSGDTVDYLENKIIAGENVVINKVSTVSGDALELSVTMPESTGLFAGKVKGNEKTITFTGQFSANYAKTYIVGAASANWAFTSSNVIDMCSGDFESSYSDINGSFSLPREGVYEVTFSTHAFLFNNSSYPCYFNILIISSYDDFATGTIENNMQLTLDELLVYQDHMNNITLCALVNNVKDGSDRLKKVRVSITAVAVNSNHYLYATFRSPYIQICEQVKQIPGPKGDKGDAGAGGVSDGKVKVTSGDTSADYLANKIEAAPGSPITVAVVGDTLVLDAIQDDISDPLIRTVNLMTENGTMSFTGSCYSDVYSAGEWEVGTSQNTTDAYYRITTDGRGTVSKVRVFVSTLNGNDLGVSADGYFGAIRIGLFDTSGNCKGQTAWTRGISAIGTLTLDLTPSSGQNLTIDRSTEYWIGICARGMDLISYNKESTAFTTDDSLRYSVSIRSGSNNASWSPNFWNSSGGGFVQQKIAIAMMTATS